MPIRWEVDYVAFRVGWDEPPSLAFGSSGQPAIACFAGGSNRLDYYERDGNGSWSVSPIDTQVNNSGDVSCSLAFHFNQPAVSYCVFGGSSSGPDELRYAYYRGTAFGWIIGRTIPAAWAGSSLALAPNGHPAIAFCGPGHKTIRYTEAGSNVTVWTDSIADEDAKSSDVSLAFTSAGAPAVAYNDSGGEQSPRIKYGIFDGGQWIVETVAEAGDNPSLGFDSSGQPIIVFGTRSPMALMCARRGPSAWQISKIVDWGYSPSLAFTPAGDPAIAYIDLVYHAAVKYAVYKNGWTHYLVDQPVKQQASAQGWYYWYYPSLAFNPVTGEPAIAYFQYDTSCIKYAVGRIFPRSFGDVFADLMATLAHLVARKTRPKPPAQLPAERERFRRVVPPKSG